jgi:hypothetical protein
MKLSTLRSPKWYFPFIFNNQKHIFHFLQAFYVSQTVTFVVFVFGLFNDALSSGDYTALNDD